MAKLDMTSLEHAAKRLYPETKIEQLLAENSPFYAMLTKWEKFYGKLFEEVLISGPGAGRGTTIAHAQNGYSPHAGQAFLVRRKKDYAVAVLEGEAIEAAENDAGSVINALKTESDMALERFSRSTSHGIWGDGSGAIGRIATGGVAGTVITLESPEDIVHFEVNMLLQANPTKTGAPGTLRASAGTMKVTAVDRDLGKVTVDAALAGLAAADYLYPLGDYDAKMYGFSAWIPASAPGGGDNFNGVNRSQDPVRLAGHRYAAANGEPISEALQGVITRIGRERGRPTKAFANPTRMLQLVKELGPKVEYTSFSVGTVGFQGVKVQTDKHVVEVFSDPNVPVNSIPVVDMRTWTFRSLKKYGRLLNRDGNEMLRQTSDDAYELRWGGYGNLSCRAPGWNGVIVLS